MTAVPFPLISAPGSGKPQVAAGGRLINTYPAKRCPRPQASPMPIGGCRAWACSAPVPSGLYRGGTFWSAARFLVCSGHHGLFVDFCSAARSVPLTGAVPGTADCFFAQNMNTPPDVCIVSPGIGAFVITGGGTAISNYPGSSVGSPNAVTFLLSFFVFTYGSGLTQTSDPNSTNVNVLNFANAQSKPDVLYRPVALGNGQLLLCGANYDGSVGRQSGQLRLAIQFSYVSTIPRGIPGPYSIAGDEDGWGKGIFFVGDDGKVSTLTTYTPTPISTPDIEDLIDKEPVKSAVTVSVYVSRGHGFVVVQGPNWCWEYDTTLQSWHERQSYLVNNWRAHRPIYAFSQWLCGDNESPTLCTLSSLIRNELGNPLAMRLETGPFGAFPQKMRINGIELYMTKGVSIATGHDPDETNAQVGISISRDGGNTWSNLGWWPSACRASPQAARVRQFGDNATTCRACAGASMKAPD